MSNQTYTLHIVNNSGRLWDMCLYQRGPDVGPDRFPIAWLVKPAQDTSKVTFRWSADGWGFVWAETGRLAPGGQFDVAQTWPANPAIHRPATPTAAGDCVTLALAQRAYLFVSPSVEPAVPAGKCADHGRFHGAKRAGLGRNPSTLPRDLTRPPKPTAVPAQSAIRAQRSSPPSAFPPRAWILLSGPDTSSPPGATARARCSAPGPSRTPPKSSSQMARTP
jgi:hypothetical protein